VRAPAARRPCASAAGAGGPAHAGRAARSNAAALLVLLPWQRRLRLAAQVVPPLALAAAALALEAALAAAPGAPGAAVALCTLGVTAVLGAATALLQGGVYALAACLTPLYVQARAGARLLVVARPGGAAAAAGAGPRARRPRRWAWPCRALA
jgi:hypothetical protein